VRGEIEISGRVRKKLGESLIQKKILGRISLDFFEKKISRFKKGNEKAFSFQSHQESHTLEFLRKVHFSEFK